MLVHAIGPDARRFHEGPGFESSPTDPLNLQLLVKDIRAALSQRLVLAQRSGAGIEPTNRRAATACRF